MELIYYNKSAEVIFKQKKKQWQLIAFGVNICQARLNKRITFMDK